MKYDAFNLDGKRVPVKLIARACLSGISFQVQDEQGNIWWTPNVYSRHLTGQEVAELYGTAFTDDSPEHDFIRKNLPKN